MEFSGFSVSLDSFPPRYRYPSISLFHSYPLDFSLAGGGNRQLWGTAFVSLILYKGC